MAPRLPPMLPPLSGAKPSLTQPLAPSHDGTPPREEDSSEGGCGAGGGCGAEGGGDAEAEIEYVVSVPAPPTLPLGGAASRGLLSPGALSPGALTSGALTTGALTPGLGPTFCQTRMKLAPMGSVGQRSRPMPHL